MGTGNAPTPPTATEDMSIVQKCEQLEVCLVECHAVVAQMQTPQELNMDKATESTPGAHGSLNRLDDSAQRLLARLRTLQGSVGQV